MSMSGLIVPYNDIVDDYTSHVPCLGNMDFSFGWTRVDGEEQNGWIVPAVFICPLLCT